MYVEDDDLLPQTPLLIGIRDARFNNATGTLKPRLQQREHCVPAGWRIEQWHARAPSNLK